MAAAGLKGTDLLLPRAKTIALGFSLLLLSASCSPPPPNSHPPQLPASKSANDTTATSPNRDLGPTRTNAFISEREKHDGTTWSQEVQAQRCERRFSQLWDDLRTAPDPWSVLLNAVAPQIQASVDPIAEDLELGIRRIRFGARSKVFSANEFRERIDGFRRQGFRLLESEWHHSRYDPDHEDGPRSEFSFVLHLQRPAAPTSTSRFGARELRAIVRGILVVDWPRPENTRLVPVGMRLRDVEILTRSGLPAFERVFSYSRRSEDVASAHPILLQDLDANGFDDIVISRWNRVYLNGGGQFTERRFLAHFQPHGETGVLADFDGDGSVDFFTIGVRGQPLLFRGDDEGQFPRPAETVSEARFDAPLAVTVGDIDDDGDVDIWQTQYRLSYVDGHMPTPYYDANDGYPAALLENDGQGGFTDITEAGGLAAKRNRRTYSTSLVDLDDDGDLDLVVVSDFAGLDIYTNDGQGHFTEVTHELVENRHLFGMAHTFGDYDVNGTLDLYAIGMSSTTARRLDRLGLGRGDRPLIHRMRAAMAYGNRMYLAPSRTAPAGRYRTPAFAHSVARTGWSWGTTSFDFDNDRDTDIYVANGFRSGRSARDYCTRFWCHDIYTGSSTPDPKVKAVLADSLRELDAGDISWNGYEHNALLLNLNGRDFLNVGFLMGVGCEFDSRAVVSNDLDGDGQLDLLVTQYEFDGRGFVMTLHVYRNTLSTANHWIGVRLQPMAQAAVTVGARIRVLSQGTEQIARIVTGDSWGAQHANQVHFGLGAIDAVEALEIRWPDGQLQRIENPAVDRYHQTSPSGG